MIIKQKVVVAYEEAGLYSVLEVDRKLTKEQVWQETQMLRKPPVVVIFSDNEEWRVDDGDVEHVTKAQRPESITNYSDLIKFIGDEEAKSAPSELPDSVNFPLTHNDVFGAIIPSLNMNIGYMSGGEGYSYIINDYKQLIARLSSPFTKHMGGGHPPNNCACKICRLRNG